MPSDALSSDAVVRAVARFWEVAAITAIAATVAAWLWADAQPKRYRTSSVAAVAAAPRAVRVTDSQVLDGVDNLERRLVVESLAALASTDVLHRRLRARDGERISGALVEETNLVRIDAEAATPARAATLANAAARALDTESRALFGVYPVALVSPAVAPQAPASPRVERMILAGLVLGSMLGAAIAWGLDRRW